jgi:hypothetical protein
MSGIPEEQIGVWYQKLPTQAKQTIERLGVEQTRDAIAKAILDGTMRPSKCRGYGKKSDAELREKLGLPAQEMRRLPKSYKHLRIPADIARWKYHPMTGEPL